MIGLNHTGLGAASPWRFSSGRAVTFRVGHAGSLAASRHAQKPRCRASPCRTSACVGSTENRQHERRRPPQSGRQGAAATTVAAPSSVSVVGVIGELLITAGVLILLFLGWQLWLGDIDLRRPARAESHRARPTSGIPAGTAVRAPDRRGRLRRADRRRRARRRRRSSPSCTCPRFGADCAFIAGASHRPHARQHRGRPLPRHTQMPGEVGNFAVAAHRTTHGGPSTDRDTAGRRRDLHPDAGRLVHVRLPQPRVRAARPGSECWIRCRRRPECTRPIAYMTMTSCNPNCPRPSGSSPTACSSPAAAVGRTARPARRRSRRGPEDVRGALARPARPGLGAGDPAARRAARGRARSSWSSGSSRGWITFIRSQRGDGATMTRVLVVDNYDSFVYTLNGYLWSSAPRPTVAAQRRLRGRRRAPDLAGYGAVLLSPGPGTPAAAGRLDRGGARGAGGRHPAPRRLPRASGDRRGVRRDRQPRREIVHGKTRSSSTTAASFYRDVPQPFRATRYHSLAVIDSTVPAELVVTSRTESGVIMGLATAPRRCSACSSTPRAC